MKILCLSASTLLLSACAAMPVGPSVLVLPGSGKSFEQFRIDEMNCRYYAFTQIGGVTPGDVAADYGIGSSIVGTAIGAAAGAALGGGEGAAIGAGAGLLAGALSGAENARLSGFEAQQRYDMSYLQCMYANGNRVPVNGGFSNDFPPAGGGIPAPALPPRQ